MFTNKPLVYVAGPISCCKPLAENVNNMVRVGSNMVEDGVVTPLVPYNGLWEFIHPQPNDFWYNYDNELLLHCHALFVHEVPDDPTSGVWAEWKLAEERGIPVFTDLEELYEWAESEGAR